jgi:hypothetical protein
VRSADHPQAPHFRALYHILWVAKPSRQNGSIPIARWIAVTLANPADSLASSRHPMTGVALLIELGFLWC